MSSDASARPFDALEFVSAMPDRIVDAFRDAWKRIADPGTWWTGEEKVALAGAARAAFSERFTQPWMREATNMRLEDDGDAPADAARIIAKIAADARQIDRDWALESIDAVGEAPYVELVALASTVAVIDAYAEAIGAEREPLPSPNTGEPSRERPDGMGDIGAFVDMADPWTDANVSRALTLCPSGNALYRGVAVPLYHDGAFLDLAWDRTMSRPQAELIATTVSAANECFY